MARNSMHDNDPQVFTMGFSLGLFTGVVGYFVFGTDQGKRLRHRLNQEWHQAQEYLQQQGVFTDNDQVPQSAKAYLQQLKGQLLQSLDIELPTADNQKKAQKKRAYHKKKQPAQFKGT